jgi:hypothetical protein
MNWMTALLGLTVTEGALAAFIYASYHGDPSVAAHFPEMTAMSMARIVAGIQLFNLGLLFLVDKASGSVSGLFYGKGRAGKNLYSHERGLFRNGDRESACERLAKAVSRRGDIEAMRLLVEIAASEPRMSLWISKSVGLRGKLKNASREDLAGLDMMLGRTVRVEKKEEPAFS